MTNTTGVRLKIGPRTNWRLSAWCSAGLWNENSAARSMEPCRRNPTTTNAWGLLLILFRLVVRRPWKQIIALTCFNTFYFFYSWAGEESELIERISRFWGEVIASFSNYTAWVELAPTGSQMSPSPRIQTREIYDPLPKGRQSDIFGITFALELAQWTWQLTYRGSMPNAL